MEKPTLVMNHQLLAFWLYVAAATKHEPDAFLSSDDPHREIAKIRGCGNSHWRALRGLDKLGASSLGGGIEQ